jgi:hypothetical protein
VVFTFSINFSSIAIISTFFYTILSTSVMLHGSLWVIPRRLNFVCRRFGTLCSIFICK